ncbi:MAG: NAD-dependent epimerase/dehydratase family protein [Flavobacteriaceae bacterium]|nr:NAD-dependent epimerase/dehydratase family protein [Flavobacteriaceae bacterium]
MKTVFVTGASGLLAVNTIKILLASQHKVIGLLRDVSKFPLQKHPNLKLVVGDITKEASYLKEITLVDSIIHIAAITSQDISDYAIYQKVNATATAHLFKNAQQNNVKRFIYISTANTFGYGTFDNLGDETKEIRYPFVNSLYAKSKLEGQERILELSKKQDSTTLIILNPTFMIGAFDTKPSSGRMILSAYKKKVLFYPPGGKSFINVKDTASAVVNSLTKGKNREAYVLSGENLTFKEFYKKVNLQLDANPIMIKIPKWLLLTVGFFGSILRSIGVKTEATLTNVETLCIYNFYSNNKAKKELNLVQQPIENGISDAIDWFNLKK